MEYSSQRIFRENALEFVFFQPPRSANNIKLIWNPYYGYYPMDIKHCILYIV